MLCGAVTIFFICFWTTPTSAESLCPGLCFGIISGGAWETYVMPGIKLSRRLCARQAFHLLYYLSGPVKIKKKIQKDYYALIFCTLLDIEYVCVYNVYSLWLIFLYFSLPRLSFSSLHQDFVLEFVSRAGVYVFGFWNTPS